MGTLTKEKPFVLSPEYDPTSWKALEELSVEILKGPIDKPTTNVVEQSSCVPHRNSLRRRHSHFAIEQSADDRSMVRVADKDVKGARLHYRIASMAFCSENSVRGRDMPKELRAVATVDPEYIQFGCARWFRERRLDSYVLQVSYHHERMQGPFRRGPREIVPD